MPAESEKQRKFMALVNSYQQGKTSDVSPEVKKAAGAMSEKVSHDFMHKKADEIELSGRKPIDPKLFSVIRGRREPSKAEQAFIKDEESKWIPEIIKNPGESVYRDLSSPSKAAILAGLLGGGLGAGAGKGIGELINMGEDKIREHKPSADLPKIDPNKLAAYGGASTAALAGMLALYKTYVRNQNVKDEGLRLAPNATRRDRDLTPAFAFDDPEYVKHIGMLNAALTGRLRSKDMQALEG